MSVDPLALAAEADHLRALGVPDPYGLLTVDRRARLVTPYHAAANRLRERARGADRHGSCGMGVGETTAYALAHPGRRPHASGDCAVPPAAAARRCALLRDRLPTNSARWPPRRSRPARTPSPPSPARSRSPTRRLQRLRPPGPVGVRGRPGRAARRMARLPPVHHLVHHDLRQRADPAGRGRLPATARRLGVVRTYTTRHGPGPLVTEDPELPPMLPEPHNGHGRWQGAFRVGHFDAVAHALRRRGVRGSGRAGRHPPGRRRRAAPSLRICHGYAMEGQLVERLPARADRRPRRAGRADRPAAGRPPRPVVHPRALARRDLRPRWARPSSWSPADRPGSDSDPRPRRIGSGRAEGLPLLRLRYALRRPGVLAAHLPRLRTHRLPQPAAGRRVPAARRGRRRHRAGRHPPHHRSPARAGSPCPAGSSTTARAGSTPSSANSSEETGIAAAAEDVAPRRRAHRRSGRLPAAVRAAPGRARPPNSRRPCRPTRPRATQLLREPAELGFPLHTLAVRRWFAGALRPGRRHPHAGSRPARPAVPSRSRPPPPRPPTGT